MARPISRPLIFSLGVQDQRAIKKYVGNQQQGEREPNPLLVSFLPSLRSLVPEGTKSFVNQS